MSGTAQFEVQSAQALLDSVKRALPENCVEYMLFVLDAQLDDRQVLQELEDVRSQALQFIEGLTAGYIWQRLAYIHGTTDFGDCIEDEWLIVYILRELSRIWPNVWIRIWDGDGEFLLVEAAGVLPKWLTPENDSNRAWIHQGQLQVIPLDGPGIDGQSKPLSLLQAVAVLSSNPATAMHSPFIEAEAFYRLEKYPAQITRSIHHAMATVPRKLALILHETPQAVGAAAEAFYLRGPNFMKHLGPEKQRIVFPFEDVVSVSVRFNKVMFAQLRSEHLEVPPEWSSLPQRVEGRVGAALNDTQNSKALDLGMKLTIGFGLLVAGSKDRDSWAAREADLVRQRGQDPDAASLPTDEEIDKWKDVTRQDDEAWLDIDLNDLDVTLEGRPREAAMDQNGAVDSGFGDKATEADLRKMVARFEAFLNDKTAGIDGAEVDDMDRDDDELTDGDEEEDEDESEGEDKDISFDEEQFARMMREMMGLPTPKHSDDQEPETAKEQSVQQADGEDIDDDGVMRAMAQTELELRQHGALSLDPTPKAKSRATIEPPRPNSGLAQSNAESLADAREAGESDASCDDEISLDYGLAKNLLESFKSQGGLAGPTGNILGMMGMRLPRDEDDADEHDA